MFDMTLLRRSRRGAHHGRTIAHVVRHIQPALISVREKERKREKKEDRERKRENVSRHEIEVLNLRGRVGRLPSLAHAPSCSLIGLSGQLVNLAPNPPIVNRKHARNAIPHINPVTRKFFRSRK